MKHIILVVNLIAILMLLVVMLGSVISPVDFVFPAYFALGLPVILLVNAAFVVFWLLVRKWLFLFSLSMLFLSVGLIRETIPVHVFDAPKNEQSVTQSVHILSYNMMMSGKLVKPVQKKKNKVLQYIVDTNADIVCLQEFMVSTRSQYLTHRDMLRYLQKYPYKHICYLRGKSTRKYGIATLSKFPIVNRQRISYKSRANLSIYTDICVGGETIRVVNNHLESNRITENEKEMPVRLRDNFDAENLKDVTMHFSRKLGVAYRLRASQADVVSRTVVESPFKVLLCGDFNDVPGSYTYTRVKGNLCDAFSEKGSGTGWTFYQKLYGFRIDYVMYDSTAFSPINIHVPRVDYSDHYPVLCNMAIKKLKID